MPSVILKHETHPKKDVEGTTSGETQYYIVDTCALLTGYEFPDDWTLVTSPKVIDELKKFESEFRIEYMIDTRISMQYPEQNEIELIKETAEQSGDRDKLSRADIDVLALAHQLKGTILTDDYGIQNVAKLINIPYIPLKEKGIKEQFIWVYQCKSCRRLVHNKSDSCPVCGGSMKRVRKPLKDVP